MDDEGKAEVMVFLAVTSKAKVSNTPVFRDVIDVADLLLVIIIIAIYDNVLDLMQVAKLSLPD